MIFNKRANNLKASPINWLIQYALENPSCISLAAGLVEQESLPVDELELATKELMSLDNVREFLQYGTTSGLSPLKKAIIKWIKEIESSVVNELQIDEDSIVVTNGSQQLLYLISELIFEPGDIVLIESPSYFVYSDTLQTQGVEFVTVDTDEYGIIPQSLEDRFCELESKGQLLKLKMLYTIPWCQNPGGSSRSPERLSEILHILKKWISKSDFLILEDAAYRSLCFNPSEVSSTLLQYPEFKERVAYATTFSKPFAPGLKLGAGILPKELHSKVTLLKGNHDFGSSHWNQAILWQLLSNKWLHQAKDRVLESYKLKATLLYDSLGDGLSTEFKFHMPSGGMYLWIECPKFLDTTRNSELFKNCLEEGVLYVPGEYCDLDKDKSEHSMRLSYGRVSENDLVEGATRLIRAISRSLS